MLQRIRNNIMHFLIKAQFVVVYCKVTIWRHSELALGLLWQPFLKMTAITVSIELYDIASPDLNKKPMDFMLY